MVCSHGQRSSSIDVSIDPGVERSLNDLLRDADLYASKAAGKRQSRIFEPAMLDVSGRELQLENYLWQALSGGGLTLAYKPIIDLHTGQISWVEALCRWNHPDLGPVRRPNSSR